jgi:hypothetical protein
VHHDHIKNHPQASVLRQRAAGLRDLAGSIERATVLRLPELAGDGAWGAERGRLCDAMLQRNIEQLHQAADDLRDAAYGMSLRAGAIELAGRSLAA